MIKKLINPFRKWLVGDTSALLSNTQALIGRMASWQVRSQRVISTLRDVEFKVTSQWGEDGIIDWLVERVNVPSASRAFVEFGVETYREANTRFLLQNRNWRGLIMDGGSAMLEKIKEDKLTWMYDLTVKRAFITRENINELISSAGFTGDIGLLSIDIDGNDYWVWEAIHVVRPIICICEYNAVFGDIYPITTPYRSDFDRAKAHHSYLYFGASIAAFRLLGAKKGYRFVGTNSAANNAFFVREDYARAFVDSSLQHIEASPSLVRESRDASGQLNYIGGMRRLEQIAALPVINVGNGESVRLGDLECPYSRHWLDTMIGTP
jgi:hypothetical protein